MKKMIFVLLFISLTCSVCETFEVRCAKSSYQVIENEDVTLEWTFTKSSLDSLVFSCYRFSAHGNSALIQYDKGVERLQEGPFRGRVQLDKDLLGRGRIRLHVSSLGTEDSGHYQCDVETSRGSSWASCRVTVKDPHTEDKNTGTGGRIGLGSGPLAAVICACVVIFLHT